MKWTTKLLVKDKSFSLPNKVENKNDTSETRIVDATESRIDRPKVNQKEWYSRKKNFKLYMSLICGIYILKSLIERFGTSLLEKKKLLKEKYHNQKLKIHIFTREYK